MDGRGRLTYSSPAGRGRFSIATGTARKCSRASPSQLARCCWIASHFASAKLSRHGPRGSPNTVTRCSFFGSGVNVRGVAVRSANDHQPQVFANAAFEMDQDTRCLDIDPRREDPAALAAQLHDDVGS